MTPARHNSLDRAGIEVGVNVEEYVQGRAALQCAQWVGTFNSQPLAGVPQSEVRAKITLPPRTVMSTRTV
jgi:hypothetical protein